MYLVFFSLTPRFVTRKSAFEHTLSNSSSWCVLSLSLSLCQSFARTKRSDASRAGPGGCGGRAVGFARAMAFPSGVKGSPQIAWEKCARIAWDVAMFEDDFPRAM